MSWRQMPRELREAPSLDQTPHEHPHALFVSPDTMATAGRYLAREWGEHGYRLAVEAADYAGTAVFVAASSDGGRWRFMVDRWGNVADLPDRRDYADAVNAYVEWNRAQQTDDERNTAR